MAGVEEKTSGHPDCSAILGLSMQRPIRNSRRAVKHTIVMASDATRMCVFKKNHDPNTCKLEHVSVCDNYNCQDTQEKKCPNYHPDYCKYGTHCISDKCNRWHLNITPPICPTAFMMGNIECKSKTCKYSHIFNDTVATIKRIIRRNRGVHATFAYCGASEFSHEEEEIEKVVIAVQEELDKCHLKVFYLNQIEFLDGKKEY